MTRRCEEISPLLDEDGKDPDITDKDRKNPGSIRKLDKKIGKNTNMGANWARIISSPPRATGSSRSLVAFHPRTLLGIPGSIGGGLERGCSSNSEVV